MTDPAPVSNYYSEVPIDVGQFKVWVIPAAGGAAVYNPANFIAVDRLIPERISLAPSSMGSASFRMLKEVREENGVPSLPVAFSPGDYCAITAYPGTASATFSDSDCIFYGYLDRFDLENVSDGATYLIDKAGSATAKEIGWLLDSTQLTGFKRSSGTGVTDVLDPPTFNLQGDGGALLGNKKLFGGSPVFAGLPSECGTTSGFFFTRNDVLKHVLEYARPRGMPTIAVDGATDAAIITYLSDATYREVFDLGGVTLRGAIDLLISRVNGFGWKVIPSGSTWGVFAYSMIADVPSYTTGAFPPAIKTTVDFSSGPYASIRTIQDASDLWDSVTVRGGKILVGATVSVADGNLVAGWTATQEAAYRAGAKNDPGYNATADKPALNEALRNAPQLADVFQLFTLNLTTDKPLRSSTPGDGGAGLPLVPEVNSYGSTNDSVNRCPYLPGATFARTVPWLVGVSGDGTDARTAEQKARPAYLTPRAWKYDPAITTSNPKACVDLLTQTATRQSPTLTIDDRSPGMRVAYSPNELLAKDRWTDGTDGTSRADPIQGGAASINYDKLALTVGIESDQRVSVTIYRDGITAETARRNLVVEDHDLQCWLTLAGTIVGAKANGDADRASTNVLVRNDFSTCQRRAEMLAAFTFRKRSSISISRASPDLQPPWAKIGVYISQITETSRGGTSKTEVNSVVESVEYDLRYDAPRINVTTTIPSAPAMGGSGSSPSAGGSVSQSLGGTVPQAALAAQATATAAAGQKVNSPVFVGKDSVRTSVVYLIIDKGNILDDGSDGIKLSTTLITSMPAYDANVNTSFVDGIGRAQLVKDGEILSGYVLVVNDLRSQWQSALMKTDAIASSGSVMISGQTCFVPV